MAATDGAMLHPEIERLDRDAVLAIQRDKLVRLGKRLSGSLEWSAHFRAAGMNPRDLADPQGFAAAPFLTDAVLRARYPLPMMVAQDFQVEAVFAAPRADGPPVMVAFTARDLHSTLPRQVARVLRCAGLRPGDRAYQALDYGQCLDGTAFEAGMRAVGATCFPVGPGRAELVAAWLRDQAWDFAAVPPGWLAALADVARGEGIEPKRDWRLRRAAVAGGSLSPDPDGDIGAAMPEGFAAHAVLSRTEAGGPILAVACDRSRAQGEMHLVNEDSVLTEILDVDGGRPAGPGEAGELVVTTLDKEATPAVRYRTGLRARLADRPFDCPCGRIGMPLIAPVGR